MSIPVKNIDELYAEIKNPANKGATLILAAGNYTLSEKKDSLNGGRLELLENMTLQGQTGNPGKVVIDASQLPNTSFEPTDGGPTRTGAIRMGKGACTLEWLTVKGSSHPAALSVIDTDLIEGAQCSVRIAHCIISGGRIGIDIRNPRKNSNFRRITAHLEQNEVLNNLVSLPNTQQGHGIIIQHANGASDAHIDVTLTKNNVHHNIIGMKIFNNSNSSSDPTSRNTTTIRSDKDNFYDNKLGIDISGGTFNGGNQKIEDNIISFTADKTTIQNNRGIIPGPTFLPCGIFVTGGTRPVVGVDINRNKVHIDLTKCHFSKNEDADIIAYGAFISPLPPPAPSTAILPLPGTQNIVTITLDKNSQPIIQKTDCFPTEPAGTNKVIIKK